MDTIPSREQAPIKIKITHESMNTEAAHALGLVIKLCFWFPDKDKPCLEIFADDAEARAKEWHIYGAPPEEEPDRIVNVQFEKLNNIRKFKITGSWFLIEFTDLGETAIDYPRGGKTMEPAYECIIEKISI